MNLLGIDTGSRWCGLAVLAVDNAGAITIRQDPATVDVNPGRVETHEIDIGPLVGGLLHVIETSAIDLVVVEHSKTWAMWKGMDPGAAMATQANWVVCDRIVRELRRLSPVPVEILHVQSWRARVVPKRPKGAPKSDPVDKRERKASADARVAAALAIHLDAPSLARLSVICPPCETATHQRDAAGVGIGYLLAPAERAPAAPRARRDPSLPKPARSAARNAGWLARKAQERADAKIAAGCDMGCKTRHVRGCAAFVAKPYGVRGNFAALDGYKPMTR